MWGVFKILTNFDWPWTPIQLVKNSSQTFCGNYMIIPVYRALDWPSSMSGTKVMAQKPRCAQKSKNCMSLPLAASAARDNSPREHARELLKPSKNSWSVLVCTEKNLFRFGFGVFGGCRQKEGRFYFFWLFFDYVITRTLSQNGGWKFDCILGWNMKLWRSRSTSWRFWCPS